MYDVLLSFWGAGNPTPFVASVNFPIIYCGGRTDHHDKACYGPSGCHREGLVFLVRPEFLLDVGSGQGGQTQAR